MGKVRKIWQDNVTMGSFYELTILRVECCERLSNIFPFNLVERLEKLETLHIWECESVEEIIRPDDDDDSHTVTSTESIELKSPTKFVFPKISFLSLYNLPKFEAFYSKVHTTEWPSLKQLEVVECNKIETFAGEYINFGETRRENRRAISVQQPLFWVTKVTFPNLEELYLIQNGNMKEIWHAPHPKHYFCKPRILELFGFPRALVTVPNCFIRSMPNHEKLFGEEATFGELCPSEGDEDAGTLAHSKGLSKKEPSLAQVLCNLEILPVGECRKLKNPVQSFVSFEHLTTLEVSTCHGFRYLVTLTTAKSMVQLKRMKVSDCQILEEIVASTIGEVMDVIVFNQLESLELDRLPSLSSFCSESTCTLAFPTLEELIMTQCPKMKIFTAGNISTPMLHGVHSTKGEYVGRWEGNLNAIIQQLFVEKVFPSLEDLVMSSINIHRVWNHKLPTIHTYAPNLTCLKIEGCRNLSCLFSPSMVKCFVQLKKPKIENCENVENVIFVEGLSKEEMMDRKLFRVLESLSLKNLPKLKRICHGNYFEFPLLTSLSIESCPGLNSFVSDAQGNYSQIATPALFDEKVGFPCLQKLTIQGVGNGETNGRSSQLTV